MLLPHDVAFANAIWENEFTKASQIADSLGLEAYEEMLFRLRDSGFAKVTKKHNKKYDPRNYDVVISQPIKEPNVK